MAKRSRTMAANRELVRVREATAATSETAVQKIIGRPWLQAAIRPEGQPARGRKLAEQFIRDAYELWKVEGRLRSCRCEKRTTRNSTR